MWLYWIRGWKKVFPMKYHLEFDREAVISKYLLTEGERLLTLDELVVKFPLSPCFVTASFFLPL